MNTSATTLRRTTRKLCAVLAFTAVTSLAQAQSFTVTDLGTISGYITAPGRINDTGTVVGIIVNSTTSPTFQHAFSYSNGTLTDLGTFGGSLSEATGINSLGTIVGNIYSNGIGDEIFSYSNGTLTYLGAGSPYAINNAGTIVGMSTNSHAFSYSNGAMTDLGTLGGSISQALSVNNTGVIVGISETTSNAVHAISYSNGVMTDLGTLGGTYSTAWRINDTGTIVGDSFIAGSSTDHAFIYSNGKMTDLGTLGGVTSSAWGINNSGTIVGRADTAAGNFDAFIYHNGTMTDLNTLVNLPGVTLNNATDINSLGQIIANGSNGHGYVLTPMSAPVPTTLQIHGSNGYRQPANHLDCSPGRHRAPAEATRDSACGLASPRCRAPSPFRA